MLQKEFRPSETDLVTDSTIDVPSHSNYRNIERSNINIDNNTSQSKDAITEASKGKRLKAKKVPEWKIGASHLFFGNGALKYVYPVSLFSYKLFHTGHNWSLVVSHALLKHGDLG